MRTSRSNKTVASVLATLMTAGATPLMAQQTFGTGQPIPAGVQSHAETAPQEAVRAMNLVIQATDVVRRMELEQGSRQLLQQAQGVFIVPDYARAALGIGARGGHGVLLVRRDGQWSDPLFFNLGALSLGLQAGVEGGDIALVLHNQRAVNSFMQQNNWSLDANAGLTVGTWSGRGQASAGRGDITLWTDAAGLLGDLAVSVANINFDQQRTTGYYGQQVAMRDVIEGRVTSPHAQVLRQTLGRVAGTPGATTGGASGGATAAGEAGTGLVGGGTEGTDAAR